MLIQHRSHAGKQNRSLQTTVHTAGSKSFVRYAHELVCSTFISLFNSIVLIIAILICNLQFHHEFVFVMQEKEKQVPINRADLYKAVHMRSDGSPINPDIAEKIVCHYYNWRLISMCEY